MRLVLFLALWWLLGLPWWPFLVLIGLCLGAWIYWTIEINMALPPKVRPPKVKLPPFIGLLPPFIGLDHTISSRKPRPVWWQDEIWEAMAFIS